MKLFSLPLEGGGLGRGCCSARLLATLILTLPLAACSLLGPAPGAFVTAAAVPATAAGGAAVLLPDGRVAAVGAFGLAIYDPLADRWQARAGPPGGGFPTRLLALPDGTLFMLRAFQSGPDQRALRYRPADDRWSLTRPMLERRKAPSVTLLEDRRVLVAGGLGDRDPNTPLTSAEIYDPSTDRWSPAANMLTRRYGQAAVLLEDGRVLIAGGNVSATVVLPAELFDPERVQWTGAGALQVQAFLPSAIRLRDGRVLLVAGLNFFAGGSSSGVEIYDPRANGWSLAAPTPSQGLSSLALLGDGRVLLLKSQPDRGLFRAEIFDPQTSSWSVTPALSGHPDTAVTLKDGRVFVTGAGAAWIYDPAASPPQPGQEGLGSPRLTLALAAIAALAALLVLGQFVVTRTLERRRSRPV